MATIKVLPSGAFQIRVVSKRLPKPFYASFDTRDEAVAFSDYLTALLAHGIVPEALAAKPGEKRTEWNVQRCIAEYIRAEPVKVSEIKLLDTIRVHVPNVKTSDMNYDWAEPWIRHTKRNDNRPAPPILLTSATNASTPSFETMISPTSMFIAVRRSVRHLAVRPFMR